MPPEIARPTGKCMATGSRCWVWGTICLGAQNWIYLRTISVLGVRKTGVESLVQLDGTQKSAELPQNQDSPWCLSRSGYVF